MSRIFQSPNDPCHQAAHRLETALLELEKQLEALIAQRVADQDATEDKRVAIRALALEASDAVASAMQEVRSALESET